MFRAVLTLSLLLLAPAIASAALVPDFQPPLEITMTPEYPHPGDQVALTVSDPAGKPGVTAYIWSVNEEIVEQGIGHTSISLTAGVLGSTQTVRVTAVENGAARSDASVIIRPATVDIVWEGDTYTPPLYLGRPLPNGQSTLTLLAIPHIQGQGGEAAANTLLYSWRMNDVPLQKQSGYGKSSISVTPPRFSASFRVSVIVRNASGSVTAENSVLIEPQAPSLLIYEDAPLLGMRFDRIVSGLFPFAGDEISFIAYPLFVNSPTLAYTWELDSSAFSVDKNHPRAAVFRKVGKGTGTHAVTVSFENAEKFLEHADTSFQLTF